MKKELQPPDSHHLSAAIGWLELGNPAEAELELENIRKSAQKHPHVLEVRWSISAKLQQWERSIAVAQTIIEVAPKRAFGWVHLSFALHELKRTQEAYDNLMPVLERFPSDWLMRYNLACYSAQLGKLDEAERWLAGAMLMGNRKEIQTMAREDPDLRPLFKK